MDEDELKEKVVNYMKISFAISFILYAILAPDKRRKELVEIEKYGIFTIAEWIENKVGKFPEGKYFFIYRNQKYNTIGPSVSLPYKYNRYKVIAKDYIFVKFLPYRPNWNKAVQNYKVPSRYTIDSVPNEGWKVLPLDK